MARGDKSKYTDKQKRMEDHIEEGYEKRGVGKDEAERRAWATVNKQTGGGTKEGGSGRGKRDSSSGSMSHSERSRAAKKGWATRRREGNA
jgi:hypothetical protein